MGWLAALLLILLAAPPFGLAQDSYQVDLSAIEREIDQAAVKSYSVGGFVEFQPTLFGLDRDAAFYRTRFFRRDRGSAFDQYGLRLRLNGSYRFGLFWGFIKTDTQVRNDFDGWNEDTKLFDAYLSFKPNANLIFEAGKKVVKWGKGYAWNPVSFVDRPKNPEDPEEALEGTTVVTADYIRSFTGPLKTLTLTTALVPVYKYVNAKFGELNAVNTAVKLYLLAYDTDVDFMVLTGPSRTTRYGFDFSRNVTPNFAVHGEFAMIHDFKSAAVNELGVAAVNQANVASYLMGLRYLTEQETTLIFEYYHNGTGFTRSDWRDFYRFVERGYEMFVTSANDRAIARASQLAKQSYGRPNAGRDYLYFRVSQKEPFDILYLTPSLTSIMNLNDSSSVLIPELAYSPMTNLEIRFRSPVLLGRERTEYGEKQNDYRIELRLRYHFDW